MGNKNSKHKKGKPLFVKPDIPKTLQCDNYSLTRHELILGKKPRDQRIYLIFDPQEQQSMLQSEEKKDPYSQIQYNAVIFLLHGTNELCTDKHQKLSQHCGHGTSRK